MLRRNKVGGYTSQVLKVSHGAGVSTLWITRISVRKKRRHPNPRGSQDFWRTHKSPRHATLEIRTIYMAPKSLRGNSLSAVLMVMNKEKAMLAMAIWTARIVMVTSAS